MAHACSREPLWSAPGVAYRRLDVPAVDELIGRGVHYGSAPTEALRYRGCDVAVIGSANSAGQAALHLAQQSRKVVLLVRGAPLESMSRYLVDRIHACLSIHVLLNCRVIDAKGADRLEALVVADSVAWTRSLCSSAECH
jgi:thioredoxin reductase (NADPH)